jgi:hypothetical protein
MSGLGWLSLHKKKPSDDGDWDKTSAQCKPIKRKRPRQTLACRSREGRGCPARSSLTMPAFVISASEALRLSGEPRPRQSLPRADELGPRAQHLAAENRLISLSPVRDNAAMEAEPTKSDPPKRRRFQFRLRTLMIVVTLLAVACWGIVDRARLIHERDDALRQARDAKSVEAEFEANDRQIAERLVEVTASDQNTIKRLQGQLRDLRNKETN